MPSPTGASVESIEQPWPGKQSTSLVNLWHGQEIIVCGPGLTVPKSFAYCGFLAAARLRTQALLGRRSPGEKTRNKEHVVNDRSASSSPPSSAPAEGVASPTAARTRLLLKGPILPTLLRLAAPNVLNLLAFAGMITFDGFFIGRISTDALAGASLAFP
jgi:hypothetical protein